jgi:hypothetical protein
MPRLDNPIAPGEAADLSYIGKHYTVLGVYPDTRQRFGTSTFASSPQEAEKVARHEADGELWIAGVIEGEHCCVDAAYAAQADEEEGELT